MKTSSNFFSSRYTRCAFRFLCLVFLLGAFIWNASAQSLGLLPNPFADTDGDGVNDTRENFDGTNPNDPVSYEILSVGLIAHYPFAGNPDDQSGFSRHGTNQGAVLAVDRFGIPDSAYSFNGTALSNIRVAHDTELNAFPITVTCWFWATNPGPGHLIGKYENAMWNGWGMAVENITSGEITAATGFYLASQQDAMISGYDGFPTFHSGTNLNDGQWHHVVLVVDGISGKIYVDGELSDTQNWRGVPQAATASWPMYIGHYPANFAGLGDYNGNFQGKIDEVRIYNRALSASEVSRLCSKESGKTEMVLVQGGTLPPESALSNKTVSAFHMARFETSWAEWKEVRSWATANGYDIGNVGEASADNHPVRSVNWFDVVKWCNAKSEMEGLQPVYTNNGSVFRSGTDVAFPQKSITATGYRLPTEAEWEWAARGGARETLNYTYSGGNTLAEVGWYFGNSGGASVNLYDRRGTWPIGSKAPNALGIHDMSGNVWEFCEDLMPSEGAPYHRSLRGGTWASGRIGVGIGEVECSVAHRGRLFPWSRYLDLPQGENSHGSSGFRYARNAIGEMVTVPGGTLPEGSSLAGQTVQPFLIGRTEVTWNEWTIVRAWAAANGYDIGSSGSRDHVNGPVHTVNWFTVVKWCNAKSEMEGLDPVYKIGNETYRIGQSLPTFREQANGYRLPLSVEWEWAARGGLKSSGFDYPGSKDLNEVGWYNQNSNFSSKPVGIKKPNELGIFDMAGNAWEWCWNFVEGGPGYRRVRGGSFAFAASFCLVSSANTVDTPFEDSYNNGFRLARNAIFDSPPPPPPPPPTPTPPDFAQSEGTYIGNFGTADLESPAEALLRTGQVLITLKSNRQFTGALVFNGRKVGFRGQFDPNGNWEDTVSVAGRLVEMEMLLEGRELGNRVSCSVVINAEQTAAFVLLPVAHTGARGDVFGWNGARLNVLWDSDWASGKRFGHGFAGATCAKDGVLRFAGRLADDTAWSGAARVVRDEGGGLRLPLAVPLNAAKGLLHGEGTLDPAADVQSGEAEFFSVGTWTWVRGANARAKAHKEGFVEGLQPFGQRWSYRRGTNPWTGQTGETSVRLLLGSSEESPGTLGPFTTTWPLNNRPVWSPIPPRGFQFTASTARGEFSGKIPARGGSILFPAANYRGVLLSPGVVRGDGILLGGGFLFGAAGSDVVELTGPLR